jgi:hypothetical protein
MILRVDSLQTALPPPSEPDPAGASAVQESGAVFNGPHPETGEDLVVAGEPHPEVAPEEIVEIANKLRDKAGLPKKPAGNVA